MYKVENNYQTSEAFGYIDSKLSTIETIISEFLTDGIKMVAEKQKKMNDLFNEIRSIDYEQSAIFDQHEYEPARLAYISLQNTFLSSGLNYVYSQFEFLLDEINSIGNELFNIKSSESRDINSSKKLTKSIHKSKAYLIKTFDINLEGIEKDWRKIDNFRKIRNCFTHSNGNILDDKSIRQYIEETQNISLSNDDILLTKDFIIEHSIVLVNYLRIVMDKLYEKKKTI
jgi:hypothetical protein